MRYVLSLVISAGLLQASSALADCTSDAPVTFRNGFSKAEELLQSDEMSLRGYVRGFTNALGVSSLLGASELCMERAFSCVAGKSDAQLAAMLRKYISDNPEVWHESAGLMTFNALLSGCMRREE